jgi:hypothetical protein
MKRDTGFHCRQFSIKIIAATQIEIIKSLLIKSLRRTAFVFRRDHGP